MIHPGFPLAALSVALVLQIIAVATPGWYLVDVEFSDGVYRQELQVEYGLFEGCVKSDGGLNGDVRSCIAYNDVGAALEDESWLIASEVLQTLAIGFLLASLVILAVYSCAYCGYRMGCTKHNTCAIVAGVLALLAVVFIIAGLIVWGTKMDDVEDTDFIHGGIGYSFESTFSYSFFLALLAAIFALLGAILAFLMSTRKQKYKRQERRSAGYYGYGDPRNNGDRCEECYPEQRPQVVSPQVFAPQVASPMYIYQGNNQQQSYMKSPAVQYAYGQSGYNGGYKSSGSWYGQQAGQRGTQVYSVPQRYQ